MGRGGGTHPAQEPGPAHVCLIQHLLHLLACNWQALPPHFPEQLRRRDLSLTPASIYFVEHVGEPVRACSTKYTAPSERWCGTEHEHNACARAAYACCRAASLRACGAAIVNGTSNLLCERPVSKRDECCVCPCHARQPRVVHQSHIAGCVPRVHPWG